MAKLIMCIGLPGSGKSTWALEQVEKSGWTWVRVNKDDIRKELGMTRASFKREQEFAVIDHRDHRIITALKAGQTVISDDTNFGKKHPKRLEDIAYHCGAEFEIKDFTDVPVETCIERDSTRDGDARVGKNVIWGMAENYLGYKRPEDPSVAPYVNDDTLPGAVICDLDGTAAIHNNRGPFDFEKCDTDLPNPAVRACLWAMAVDGVQIVYLSGRDDIVQDKTQQWLADHQFPTGPLYMRKTGDNRKDCIMKAELFDKEIRGKFRVLFCLDDRDQVVKLWRDMGLACFQVNYGAF